MNLLHMIPGIFNLQTEDLSNLDLEGIKIKTKSLSESIMGMPFYDDDIWKLIFRFAINLIIIVVIVRMIYYPTTKRKDYLFTYIMISFITFFVCVALKNRDIDTGMALGLFAIFSIIRYRTDAIPIKEMTYLFVVIGISVTNALAGKGSSLIELGFINIALVFLIYGFEKVWLLKHESTRLVIYEKIENIKPQNKAALIKDLEERTGLKINRISFGKIDFLKDVAQVFVHYYEDEQSNISNYVATSSSDDSDD